MKTVNSISGGKTSAYMAVHYPADYEVFSLVCIDDTSCIPTDKRIVQQVNDKLQKYCSHRPEFIATAEDDKVLKVVLDLEQKIGREIIWLRGDSFETVNTRRKALPNQFKRFCTTEMKTDVIFEFWLYRIGEQVLMRLGFRYDEMERWDNFKTKYLYPIACKNFGTHRQIKQTFNWRIADKVLVEDKVHHFKVHSYWIGKGIDFPDDSNCVGCFWKDSQQLRKNWDNQPLKMKWFASQEGRRTFKKRITYNQIKNILIQPDFIFGGGSGCKAGACHD